MNLHFRQYYWRWLKNLFLLFLLAVITLSLSRMGFALYFGEWSQLKLEPRDLQQAMFLGLRYDLMPLAYINIIPFLILHLAYFLPGKRSIRLSRWLIILILTLGYIVLWWIYVLDYSFYSYFQDHLNILFFGLFEDDTLAVLQSIWKNYNLLLWLGLIAVSHYGIYCLVRIMFSPYDFDLKLKRPHYKMVLTFFLALSFLALSGRGTFSRLPLSVEDAHFSSDEFINELALTGSITLNRAIKIRKVFGKGHYNYLSQLGFKTWQEAYLSAFDKPAPSASLLESLKSRTPYRADLEKKSPHVVMVVMESFGTYWNDQHGADFNILGDLDKQFSQGLLFKNFLPSENGTIGSMVSIATSQVIRPGARFLSESEFMSTKLSSSGNLPFKEKGYETHFVYGGKLGWRDLGKFLRVQDYDRLWGADEIKESMPELDNFEARDLGNEWGIFDEYLYSFMEEQLRTATKPQFFLVLTTSNHPPFEYPSTYRPHPLKISPQKEKKLTLSPDLAKRRFLALQYANQKMAEFIQRIRASDLTDNVIIALTGDHSYWVSKGVGLEEEFKRFAVPFFISAPPQLLPANVDVNRFGSHEDIFPTLYHLSLSRQEYISLGDNLLSSGSSAMNRTGLYANENGAYHHDKFWKWKDRKGLLLEQTEGQPELLKLKRKSEALISITDLYLKLEKDRKPIDEDNDQQ